MFRNYIKIAWRSLNKKPLFTVINVLGLFGGISFALLIAVFVWQELQVNKTLKNANNQYILTSEWKDPNMGIDFTTLAPLAKQLKEEYSHLVANYYRWDGITSIVSKNGENFRESIQIGDESLLKMYDFNLTHGNANTAFEKPFSVVLTAEKAFKIFGKTNVVGETVKIQNFDGKNSLFTITGVLEKMPENSVMLNLNNETNHFFIAKNTAKYFNRTHFNDWQFPFLISYVELQPGVDMASLELPLKQLIEKHASVTVQQNLKVVPTKLSDYHLSRNNARLKQMLLTLTFAGFFIVVMAIINFINISIGYAASRTKEIGVRKVLGGKRKQLIFQFIAESTVLVAAATLLACISYPILSKWFQGVIGKEMMNLSQFSVYFVAVPFLLVVVIGFLAGFYPAFVLSSFKATNALYGKFKVGKKGVYFRKALLSFQFVVALVVLIAALLVTQQINSFLVIV